MTQDVPLFDPEPPKPLHTPQQPRIGEGDMKWSDYRPLHPRKCDDCQQVQAERWRDGKDVPICRNAKHKLAQGGTTIAFICGEHKQQRIEAATRP